jgi:hypothetical protein
MRGRKCARISPRIKTIDEARIIVNASMQIALAVDDADSVNV